MRQIQLWREMIWAKGREQNLCSRRWRKTVWWENEAWETRAVSWALPQRLMYPPSLSPSITLCVLEPYFYNTSKTLTVLPFFLCIRHVPRSLNYKRRIDSWGVFGSRQLRSDDWVTPLLLLEIIAIECTECSDGYTFLSHKKGSKLSSFNH